MKRKIQKYIIANYTAIQNTRNEILDYKESQVKNKERIMKEIKILYLYTRYTLNLYGDRGNIQAIRYRAEKRGITVQIDYYYLEGQAPDFFFL